MNKLYVSINNIGVDLRNLEKIYDHIDDLKITLHICRVIFFCSINKIMLVFY